MTRQTRLSYPIENSIAHKIAVILTRSPLSLDDIVTAMERHPQHSGKLVRDAARSMETRGMAICVGGQYQLMPYIVKHLTDIEVQAPVGEVVQPRSIFSSKPFNANFYASPMSRIDLNRTHYSSGTSLAPFRGSV